MRPSKISPEGHEVIGNSRAGGGTHMKNDDAQNFEIIYPNHTIEMRNRLDSKIPVPAFGRAREGGRAGFEKNKKNKRAPQRTPKKIFLGYVFQNDCE